MTWIPWQQNSVIIEYIGDVWDMFSWYYGACDGTFPGPIRCYEDSIIGSYIFDTTIACDYVYTGIKEPEFSSSQISLSPNPFTTQAMLTFQGINNGNYKTLSVYNLLGQEVRNIFVGTSTSITINRNNLPSGMYFYKLMDDGPTVLGMGKMMME